MERSVEKIIQKLKSAADGIWLRFQEHLCCKWAQQQEWQTSYFNRKAAVYPKRVLLTTGFKEHRCCRPQFWFTLSKKEIGGRLLTCRNFVTHVTAIIDQTNCNPNSIKISISGRSEACWGRQKEESGLGDYWNSTRCGSHKVCYRQRRDWSITELD